jgi:Carboxypeptidase activation peptide
LRCFCDRVYFCRYKVFQTRDLTSEDVSKVAPLVDVAGFDFWVTPRVGRGAEIMVSPEKITLLRNTLKNLDLESRVVIEDVDMYV